MKKILTLIVAAILAVNVFASEYKHSIGVAAGLGLGVQYKVFVTDRHDGNFVIIDEFGYFTCPNAATGAYGGAIDNLVMAYQAKGAEGKGIKLDWYVGGQFKTGYDAFSNGGLIGFGGAAGFEANMKNAPIAFSFDFRPGYAVSLSAGGLGGAGGWAFDENGNPIPVGGGGGGVFASHMFDWTFTLGVRYTLPTGKKGKK